MFLFFKKKRRDERRGRERRGGKRKEKLRSHLWDSVAIVSEAL
jgi:hypothetical protein